jgi:fatty-acyl-CoA synthase
MLERSRRLFPGKPIVSRDAQGIFQYDYRQFYRRVSKLAHVLKKLGVRTGDRVATLAWNHHQHLEVYFAAPCMGAVLHTVNLRLFPDQIAYIINHAEDKILIVDEDLLPLIESIVAQLKTVATYVVIRHGNQKLTSGLQNLFYYEDLLALEPNEFPWPETLDENSVAGLCYTTATTGNPKGVPYTHRGIYLHSLAVGSRDTMNLAEKDTVLPVVPMFHANAWGLPFACTWFGAKQVFPGPRPEAKIIAKLIQQEQVTLAAGVPTIWMAFLDEIEKRNYDLSSLQQILCGGSAAPAALIEALEKKTGAEFVHAYGMTEAYPMATICRLKSSLKNLPRADQLRYKAKQGLLVQGLEMKVVSESGQEVPWDGKGMGELYLRGPWITDQYYREPERTRESIRDGWLCTGDVVTVDPEGYIQVQDRKKDLIKSGGEWISSIDLENALMSHSSIAEAAVIGVPHKKWTERPFACVVLKPSVGKLDEKEILSFLEKKVPKWWLPDQIIFLESIPKTSVGKFDKKILRERFGKISNPS